MTKGLTKEKLRSFLDKAGYAHRVADNGSFLMVLDADEDFGYDVGILFSIEGENEDVLNVNGWAVKFPVNDENKASLVFLCNKWNATHKIPKSYVDLENNRVEVECDFFLDEPVSEEYIYENCIKLPVSGMWNFYKSLVE